MIILLIIYAIIILAAYFGVFVCFFALIKIKMIFERNPHTMADSKVLASVGGMQITEAEVNDTPEEADADAGAVEGTEE